MALTCSDICKFILAVRLWLPTSRSLSLLSSVADTGLVCAGHTSAPGSICREGTIYSVAEGHVLGSPAVLPVLFCCVFRPVLSPDEHVTRPTADFGMPQGACDKDLFINILLTILGGSPLPRSCCQLFVNNFTGIGLVCHIICELILAVVGFAGFIPGIIHAFYIILKVSLTPPCSGTTNLELCFPERKLGYLLLIVKQQGLHTSNRNSLIVIVLSVQY